jgi:Xaa-Pro aminopeptidase
MTAEPQSQRHADRVADLQEALRTRDADLAVVYPGPNALYLTGVYGEPLDRHFLVAVPVEGQIRAVTPRKSLDLLEDRSSVSSFEVLESNDPEAVAERFVETLPSEVAAIRLDERTPYSVSRPLERTTDATVAGLHNLVEPLRIRKDDAELEAMKRSAAVADEVSTEIRNLGEEVLGMTEAEVADEVRGRLHAKGATRLSFDVVVASGPNAARPYLRNRDREIRAGEPVILDFGGFVDGYASDQTRTTVFGGDPPDGFVEAYETVRAALDAGVDAVEPGVTAGAVDRATEAVVRERGFGEHLIHGTGHGVGLEAHEAPAIADGNERTLEPGMVFSVEPGVYVEGEYGVRVEDLVVVTEDGAERLNDSPRTWRPL